MYYVDGSVYEGEWLDDKRSGKGLLRLCKYSMDMYSVWYSTLLPSALLYCFQLSFLPQPMATATRVCGVVA